MFAEMTEMGKAHEKCFEHRRCNCASGRGTRPDKDTCYLLLFRIDIVQSMGVIKNSNLLNHNGTGNMRSQIENNTDKSIV